ncbi:predicted protein [Plenodomus lingam JN3]|uniref:Predicted protein n=1 Tax=Leptosphaeria maculans (strain JN3 / isolate v23.1.3 / race Av1-4-5-6-7-8) TaxID=985895 RepID=E4ZU72_LEPMJ|nr:predicted protein [Plenodomus lingam JN3]CBX94951.1 predicted protein [Plenodomus lingam JN3]
MSDQTGNAYSPMKISSAEFVHVCQPALGRLDSNTNEGML